MKLQSRHHYIFKNTHLIKNSIGHSLGTKWAQTKNSKFSYSLQNEIKI